MESVVVEGEKCVLAVRSLGLRGYTSLNGARGASRSDWSVVSGDVLVLADNDEAGLSYGNDVKRLLEKQGCRVRVKQLAGPEGYDVADFVSENADVHPALLLKEILK